MNFYNFFSPSRLIFSFLLLPTASALFAQNSFIDGVRRQEIETIGKQSYERHCIGCHGEKGDGNGKLSIMLNPRPRDFTKGIYKFRSTPVGSLPTDADLMRTISQGIYGTSMTPGFADLPEVERMAIIEYIKKFFPNWNEKQKASAASTPFAIEPKEDFLDYKKFIAHAEKGRTLFIDNCVMCHGKEGLGNGEGAVDLLDEWGQAIKPANLQKAAIKSGKTHLDIYRSIINGIDGTPMPMFYEAIPSEEIWNLTAYVLYLRGFSTGRYNKATPPLPVIP